MPGSRVVLRFSVNRHSNSPTHLLAAGRKNGLSSLSHTMTHLGSNGIAGNCPGDAAGGRVAGDRIPGGRRGKLRTAAKLSPYSVGGRRGIGSARTALSVAASLADAETAAVMLGESANAGGDDDDTTDGPVRRRACASKLTGSTLKTLGEACSCRG